MDRNPYLPLADRAGRGELTHKIQRVARDMLKVGFGNNPHEYARLSRTLDTLRTQFHKLYGVKEH